MKKVVNGKKYDTETAQFLAEYEYCANVRDFHHFSESLYQKKTGEFFLYGEGGPLSQYAVAVGTNEWSGGERIMPLSYEEAQRWAEEHLDGDEYEEIFGEVLEDNDRSKISASVSASTAERAKRAAAKAGISVSAYLEQLILSDSAASLSSAPSSDEPHQLGTAESDQTTQGD